MKKISDSLKSLVTIVSSAAPEVNYLASASAILLTVKILLLNRFVAPFFGAYELGVIVEAVLASIIASYVFYLIVVHLAEYEAQQQIEPFAKKHLQRVVGDAQATLAEIAQAAKTSLDLATISQDALKQSLEAILVHSESPLVIGPSYRPANWIEFFSYRANRTKSSAEKLFRHVTLLDARRIRLITDIDDCSYFNQLESMGNMPIRQGSNLGFLSGTQFTYFQLCNELRDLENME